MEAIANGDWLNRGRVIRIAVIGGLVCLPR